MPRLACILDSAFTGNKTNLDGLVDDGILAALDFGYIED